MMAWFALVPRVVWQGLASLAILGAAWFGFARHYENKGAAHVVEASQKAGEIANAKNEEVRAATGKPGAFERLRKQACRDCQ